MIAPPVRAGIHQNPLAVERRKPSYSNHMGKIGEIWLMRHGETEWSRNGKHTSVTDLPLTPQGEQRAMALVRMLAGKRFELVLTSPLRRAADTCRLAGYGEVARTIDDLKEWSYGQYEGRTTADIQTENSGWTIWTANPPGGETAEQVASRADKVIELASVTLESGGDVALFSHGHMLRVLTARWLGLEATAGRLFALSTGSISVLGHEHETRVISSWNQVR